MKQRPPGFIMIVVILSSKKLLARKAQGTLSVLLIEQSKKYNPMHFINKQKYVHNILCMCQKKHISHISKSHPKPSKTNLAVLALINPSTSLSGSWRTRKSHSGGRRRYHLDSKVGGVCQYSWKQHPGILRGWRVHIPFVAEHLENVLRYWPPLKQMIPSFDGEKFSGGKWVHVNHCDVYHPTLWIPYSDGIHPLTWNKQKTNHNTDQCSMYTPVNPVKSLAGKCTILMVFTRKDCNFHGQTVIFREGKGFWCCSWTFSKMMHTHHYPASSWDGRVANLIKALGSIYEDKCYPPWN